RDVAGVTPSGTPQFELTNAPLPTRTWGAESMLRLLREPFRVTATYAYTRATAWDETAVVAARREVPLIPRHTAGVVASFEQEGVQRVGFEFYYTGRQALHDNPYRSESRPYVVVGVLAERVLRTPFGSARLFVNAENLLDVRQTRVDPLLLPSPGLGGRRTADVWSLLEGRTFNIGVRLSY
ncbi:MAG: TonB-dependent receptor, partial [Gemmatimonadaceae bacterium]|nr:TonB-dependent receptor [Gemmatimonadaceae bacterium]